MKIAIILGLMAVATGSVNSINLTDVIEEEWSLFKIQFKKLYKDMNEETFRKNVYLENKLKITKHNKMYENNEVTYALEMNHLGDLTEHEYSSRMTGLKPSLYDRNENYTNVKSATFLKPENKTIPSSIDWRKKGCVTPVKNQGQCGSCWAFSASGALEGHNFRKTGVLTSLSEQNLVDCSYYLGNEGCNGGDMVMAFKYIKENHGIDTEKSYPYEAEEYKCRYKAKDSGATVKSYVILPKGKEDNLVRVLATKGPVSVAIDASLTEFQFYKKGVHYNSKCTSRLNHGVLVVGYDTDKEGGDYWIVKNSWGKFWGDKGYILMARNKNNNCGIASYASYPIV